VAYSQREFSYDNHLMELIRHTIEFLKRKPYGNNLLIRVKDEVKLVVEATQSYEPYDRQKVIDANKKNTVRHAYFREYLALQRLCLLILQHQKHQIGSGSRQIYGILFDGAWLWEEYVSSLIDEAFYHPMNKGGKGAQRLFDGNIGLIYPDFISRDTGSRIIADAKYKPIDNIGNRDYLQVLAYMFRFDAKEGYYLYPEVDGADDQKLRMNSGSTYEGNVEPREDIHVTKHGLKIPSDVDSYTTFASKMQMSELAFRQVLVRNI
jgi:5-methylcytosine-specific restriction endonuclease McrBC regulatory subunit McrC